MLFLRYPRRYLTLKGEKVYSSGEKRIADFLNTSNIRYEYETPIKLGRKTFWPDFFLPDYSIYIEYFGMINDPSYANQAQEKKIAYYENKLNVIYIIPQHLNYLGTIINQHLRYKKGEIPKTQYLRLAKDIVPRPLSRHWLASQKQTPAFGTGVEKLVDFLFRFVRSIESSFFQPRISRPEILRKIRGARIQH